MKTSSRFFLLLSVFIISSLACGLPLASQRSNSVPSPSSNATVEKASPTPEAARATATPKPAPVFKPGDFKAVAGLPAMKLTGLWAAPDGAVWVSGSQGIYRFNDLESSKLTGKAVHTILGSDSAGRIWAIFGDKGDTIGYYQDHDWKFFGKQDGWDALPEPVYLATGPGQNLVTDAQGRVWWATGVSELRRFDPQDGTWTSLTAKDLNLPALSSDAQGYFFSEVLLPRSKNVWAGTCAGAGEAYLPGGISRFDGKTWTATDAMKANCVLAMKIAPNSDIWAGGFDGIWQYCQACNSWKQYFLPAYDRTQLISAIDFDPQGNAWVEAIRFGGASAFGSVARYHFVVKEGKWYQDYEAAPYSSTSLAFGKKNGPFLAAGGALYDLTGNRTVKIRNLEHEEYSDRLQMDSTGLLWIARLGDPEGGLWVYQP